MSDERKRENEEEKLKDFFHNVIGIKSEAVLEVLAENSWVNWARIIYLRQVQSGVQWLTGQLMKIIWLRKD